MQRRSKVLGFAIPVIVVLSGLMIYQYGYQTVSSRKAFIREMQLTKTRTLEKYITMIAERPLIETRLAFLTEKRKADDSKIIDAQTITLAANTLGDTAKGIIVGRGGTILSERVDKPEDLGKFKVVNISMDFVLPDIKALSEIIYNIETRTPYIVVKELDTRVRNFREPRELVVKLRIAALTGGK